MGAAVAFLTSGDLSGYVHDDELAVSPLRELGVDVTFVPWTTDADWNRFELVVVRSTWDYQHDPASFLHVLANIDASCARLQNPLTLMRWNLHKRYLWDLSQQGVPVLPTEWGAAPDVRTVRTLFAKLAADEIVLKPAIGASAGDLMRLHADASDAELGVAVAPFGGREYLAQPFLSQFVTEGEYALIYLEGVLSHAILKTPKAGDFRVQEEHGGLICGVVPDARLCAAGERALRVLPAVPLYARVDLVRSGDDFLLGELELIEPSLYLRMDEQAPRRLARAVAARCTSKLATQRQGAGW